MPATPTEPEFEGSIFYLKPRYPLAETPPFVIPDACRHHFSHLPRDAVRSFLALTSFGLFQ
jgi:hypothetical protein